MEFSDGYYYKLTANKICKIDVLTELQGRSPLLDIEQNNRPQVRRQ